MSFTRVKRVRATQSPTYGDDSRGLIAVATVALLVLGLVAPALATAIAIIGLTLTSRRAVPMAGFAVTAVITTMMAFINIGKAPAGDWIWYSEHYQVLETMSLREYLGAHVGTIRTDITEPVYYTVSAMLSRLTGANLDVLSVAVTILIYVPLGVAIVLSGRSATNRSGPLIVATAVAMLTGITFTLSTQLVRQEIASAFVALGIVLAGMRKLRSAVLVLAIASLTHNSAAIPAAGLLLAIVLARQDRGLFMRVFVSAAIFIGLGQVYLVVGGGNAYRGANDGEVSVAVIVFDLAILATFTYLVARRGLSVNPIARTVLMCAPAFYGFALGVISQPLPFLRMYFFIEILRALMLCLICIYLTRGVWGAVVGPTLILAGVIYFELRMLSSPFVYDTSVASILVFSPFLSG